jgi:HEAT repeat protein
VKSCLLVCAALAAGPFTAPPPGDRGHWEKLAAPKEESATPLHELSEEELLEHLRSADASDRDGALRELVRRGEKSRPALLKLLRNGAAPRPARVAALTALLSLWNADAQAGLLDMLREPAPELRRLAAEGLACKAKVGDREVHEALIQLLNDQDQKTRRAVILAIGKVGAAGAEDVLINALQFDDGKDAALRAGIIRAIGLVGPRGVEALFALMDSGVQADRDRAVEAFVGLRTLPGALALPRLLKNRYLTQRQRTDLTRAALEVLSAVAASQLERALRAP